MPLKRRLTVIAAQPAAFPLAFVAAVATPATAFAQGAVKVSVEFAGDARARAGEADGVGRVLATRQAARAWQDSVDVLLDQELEVAEARGYTRARAGERAQYRVTVVALPVISEARQPTGMVTYALTLFEPALASPWRYVSNTVAYSRGAEQAAAQIAQFALDAVAERRTR